MIDCQLLETCLFFNDKMANMPSTAELIKLKYCRNDNNACARYMVYKAIGREKVPQDLFPNNVEMASKIVAQS